MNRIRKLTNRINNESVRKLAFVSTNLIVQGIIVIAIFNLLGQGLIAHAVAMLYFFGMMIVLDEELKKEAKS